MHKPAAGIRVVMTALMALVLGAPLVARERPLAEHVVLISIDGFRPELYRDPRWPVPTIQEIQREATGRLRESSFTVGQLARDDRVGAIAAYLLDRYRPALLTAHVIGTDHFQHRLGRESPRVSRAVGAADRVVGRILEQAEQAALVGRTAFLVTGDHGFSDLHTRLAPNVWLAQARLLEEEP